MTAPTTLPSRSRGPPQTLRLGPLPDDAIRAFACTNAPTRLLKASWTDSKGVDLRPDSGAAIAAATGVALPVLQRFLLLLTMLLLPPLLQLLTMPLLLLLLLPVMLLHVAACCGRLLAAVLCSQLLAAGCCGRRLAACGILHADAIRAANVRSTGTNLRHSDPYAASTFRNHRTLHERIANAFNAIAPPGQ